MPEIPPTGHTTLLVLSWVGSITWANGENARMRMLTWAGEHALLTYVISSLLTLTCSFSVKNAVKMTTCRLSHVYTRWLSKLHDRKTTLTPLLRWVGFYRYYPEFLATIKGNILKHGVQSSFGVEPWSGVEFWSELSWHGSTNMSNKSWIITMQDQPNH